MLTASGLTNELEVCLEIRKFQNPKYEQHRKSAPTTSIWTLLFDHLSRFHCLSSWRAHCCCQYRQCMLCETQLGLADIWCSWIKCYILCLVQEYYSTLGGILSQELKTSAAEAYLMAYLLSQGNQEGFSWWFWRLLQNGQKTSKNSKGEDLLWWLKRIQVLRWISGPYHVLHGQFGGWDWKTMENWNVWK